MARILSLFIKELSPTTIDLYVRKMSQPDNRWATGAFGIKPQSLRGFYA